MKNPEITPESPSYVFDELENNHHQPKYTPLEILFIVIMAVGIIATFAPQIANKIYNWLN
jgi:hypothetical protein